MEGKLTVQANLTVAGVTKGQNYDVIPQNGMLIKNSLIQIVLDDGSIALRAFKAFTPITNE